MPQNRLFPLPRLAPALALLAALALGACQPISLNNIGGRSAAVELVVKSNWPGILAEIDAGGGPVLAEAMRVAGIPQEEWPARVLQLQGNRAGVADAPGSLVSALVSYGG